MTAADPAFDARFWSQYEVVLAAAAEHRITLDHAVSPSRRRITSVPDQIFEKDCVLVAAEHEDAVRSQLDADSPVPQRGVRCAPGNEARDRLLLRFGGERVPDLMERLKKIPEVPQNAALPNHLVSICPVCLCPAAEPIPAGPTPIPPPVGGDGGRGVRVEVIDTGVFDGFRDGHPWLGAADGDPVVPVPGRLKEGAVVFPDVPGVIGKPKAKPIGPGGIREYAGHGVFIAGVLRCVAPGVEVHVSNALQWAGANMEDGLGQRLVDGLLGATAGQPHIISLSAGSRTLQDLPHAGLEAFFEELARPECTTLLVAAAGNDGADTRFYPAAFSETMPDRILSVGALREDGTGRACFSNFGDWVDVFAPGERLVNAFLTGPYTYVDPPPRPGTDGKPICRYYENDPIDPNCTCRETPPEDSVAQFTGMARWSGTSFATPLVAGLIAAHMSETGETNARVAAQQIMATARAMADGSGRMLLP